MEATSRVIASSAYAMERAVVCSRRRHSASSSCRRLWQSACAAAKAATQTAMYSWQSMPAVVIVMVLPWLGAVTSSMAAVTSAAEPGRGFSSLR